MKDQHAAAWTPISACRAQHVNDVTPPLLRSLLIILLGSASSHCQSASPPFPVMTADIRTYGVFSQWQEGWAGDRTDDCAETECQLLREKHKQLRSSLRQQLFFFFSFFFFFFKRRNLTETLRSRASRLLSLSHGGAGGKLSCSEGPPDSLQFYQRGWLRAHTPPSLHRGHPQTQNVLFAGAVYILYLKEQQVNESR